MVTWIEARSRLINVDDVLNPSMTDHAMRSVMGSEREVHLHMSWRQPHVYPHKSHGWSV